MTIKKQVRNRIGPGVTKAELIALAAEIGCRSETVVFYASQWGFYFDNRTKLPPIDDVLALLKAGESPHRIGRRHGVTKQAVHRALTRNGYRLQRGVVFQIEREAA